MLSFKACDTSPRRYQAPTCFLSSNTFKGMLPGTFAYVFLGGAGRVAADAAASGGTSLQPVQLLLYAVGVAATLAVTKLAADAASKVLERDSDS